MIMTNEVKWKMLYTLICDVKHKMYVINDSEEGNNNMAEEIIEYLNNGFKNILEC